MKYVLRLLLFCVVAVTTFSCSTGRRLPNSSALVTHLTENVPVSDGAIVYGLPMTVLEITIEAERTIEKPGPYAAYAESLLGLKEVIRSESEMWAINGVTVSSHDEPDPSQFYMIEADGTFASNILSLKREGLILDLNPGIYERSGLTGLSGETDLGRLKISDLGADEYFVTRRDTAFRLVKVDTTFIRIPYLTEKKQKFSVEQLAEKAAIRLMEMRDGKHMILTGETNVFPQGEASINELNRLEREYTELFTGKTVRQKLVFSYEVIPEKAAGGNKITICRFSEVTGPAKAGETGGIPVDLELIPGGKTGSITTLPSGVQGKQSASPTSRLFYRVPDVVTLKISYGNESFKPVRRLIYQLGEIVQLPSNFVIGK